MENFQTLIYDYALGVMPTPDVFAKLLPVITEKLQKMGKIVASAKVQQETEIL